MFIKRILGIVIFSLLFASNVSAQCVEPTSGIVAWWPFDETSGTTAVDIITNRNGSYVGLPIQDTGLVGNALRFDGNDYVEVPDSDLWAFGDSNFTIEFWANFDTPGGGSVGNPGDIFIGSDEGGGRTNKWFFALGGGYLNLHVNGPGGYGFSPLVPFNPVVGQWYHLAITKDGDTYSIYIDGILAGSESNGITVPNANTPLTIGQAEGLGFMNGRLDEISIYNRALSEAELTLIARAGEFGKCNNLVLSISTQSLPSAHIGVPYSQDLHAMYAPIPYEWSLVAGVLPEGLYVDPSGFILGTPTQIGTYPITLRVTDSENNFAEADFSIQVVERFNYAMQFDGDDSIVIPHSDSLNFAQNEPMTMEFWFKYTGSRSIYHIMGKRQGTTHGGLNYQLARDGNGLLHFGSCSDVVSAGIDMPFNEWTHIAISYDGAMLTMYLNGAKQVQTPFLMGCETTAPFMIGASGTYGGKFIGFIDEVRFWETARPEEEIAEYYNKTINPSTPGLIGYWNFDEEQFNQNVYDWSGTENNGTLGGTSQASTDDPVRVISTAMLTAINTDAEVAQVIAPESIVDYQASIIPQVMVRNNGSQPADIPVTFQIGFDYKETTSISLASGESNIVTFPEWIPNEIGSFPFQAKVALANDSISLNDAIESVVAVRSNTTSPIITGISPNTGGNTGSVTVTINGDNFNDVTGVKLVKQGEPDIVGSLASVGEQGTEITTTFNLIGMTQGPWDVVVTNLDGITFTFQEGFTIEKGGTTPNLWIDVLGPSIIRIGRPKTYWVVIGNSGNNDSRFAHALFKFPKSLSYSTNVPKALPGTPTPVEANNHTFAFGVPKLSPGASIVTHLNLTSDGQTSSVGAGIIDFHNGSPEPVYSNNDTDSFPPFWPSDANAGIPPPGYIVIYDDYGDGGSVAISYGDGSVLHLLPGGGIRIHPLNDGPLQPSTIIRPPDWSEDEAIRRLNELSDGLRADPNKYNGEEIIYDKDWPIGNFPETNCLGLVHHIWPELKELPYDVMSNGIGELYDRLYNYWYNESLSNEGIELPPYDRDRLELELSLPDLIYDIIMNYLKEILGVGSLDPNDKVGATGVGEGAYITGEVALPYVVYFENVETATAPAQEVSIVDQLDINTLDLSTLSLGRITFGNRHVDPPSGLKEYHTEVDLRPDQNLLVRIDAKLDPFSGVLTWKFTSIDPLTGELTEDPFAGFLPPNVTPPEGDGSVFYTVMPKQGLATGTEIRNKASIIFDVNPPIETPEWLNTIDSTNPESEVLPLYAEQISPDFEVQWAGTDIGAGVSDYTIYVSENAAPYQVWLENTADTAAIFSGQDGSKYEFYSVARDLTGNMEGHPELPDTTTTVTVFSNQPPIVNAGPDQTVECAGSQGTPVTLDGSASSDPDNDPLTYIWSGDFGTSNGEIITQVFSLGTHTVTLTVDDGNGGVGTDSVEINIQDTIPPVLTLPPDITTIATGELTQVDIGAATATDTSPVTITNNASESGFPVGTTLVKWIATDDYGNATEGTQTVNVHYDFGGFLPPLKADGTYKLGRTLPVKFQLFFANGMIVSTANATIAVYQLYEGGVTGEPMELESTSSADAGNTFRFSDDKYIFNLNTKTLSAGKYRLMVDLNDGSPARNIDIGLK